MHQRLLVDEHFQGVDKNNDGHALELVRAGKRKSVSAAWWGFDPNDSTKVLQAAFDSGADVILIPARETPWIVEELHVRSNTVMIIEEGARIEAKQGSFQGSSESLLNLVDVENVSIYGYGATIRMHKEDYTTASYAKGEWRHSILICGGKNIRIAGLVCEKSGGDGIYLGRGNKRITNSGIVLEDLVLREHYRQGISVITARDLVIENVEMSFTSGTPPSAGIDFEPNLPDEPIVGCYLKNCIIRNNAGAGFQCWFMQHNEKSVPFEITVSGCTVYGNPAAIFVEGFGNNATGKIVFDGNRFYGLVLIAHVPQQLTIEQW